MAFTQEPVRTPVAIADIEVRLFDPEPNTGQQANAFYSVQIKMSDGTIVVREGLLTPHLTQTQVNQLLAFMAAMRTKAANEFLP